MELLIRRGHIDHNWNPMIGIFKLIPIRSDKRGLGVFLLRNSPLVNVRIIMYYSCINMYIVG